MKKIILTFILITVFLSGCSKMQKSPAVTAVTTGLSFNAEISTDDGVYNYSVKINKNGDTEMESINTDGSAYINYLFAGDNVTYKYGNLEYKTTIFSLNENTAADLIHLVFKNITEEKRPIEYNNEQYYIKGDTKKYKYTVFIGGSGIPLKITEENKNITVLIKNAKIIN